MIQRDLNKALLKGHWGGSPLFSTFQKMNALKLLSYFAVQLSVDKDIYRPLNFESPTYL